MDLYDKIVNRKAKISLVGLGYVGMPIAVARADRLGTDQRAGRAGDSGEGKAGWGICETFAAGRDEGPVF